MQKSFIAPVCISLTAATLLFAAHVTTDYDHHADFSRYKTYSWIGVKAGPLWEERIQADVDSALAAKGWQKSASNGDAALSAFGSTQNQQRLNTFYDGFPGWRWGGFGESTTTVENTKIGTLVVDIFDGQSKHLIWRAQAAEALSGKPEKNEKKLADTVDDMFKKFPPSSKG